MAFHRALEKLKRCLAVAPFCDECFKHLAFVVDGAPQVVALAVDPDKTSWRCQRQFE